MIFINIYFIASDSKRVAAVERISFCAAISGVVVAVFLHIVVKRDCLVL
jgi:hypothetical protein